MSPTCRFAWTALAAALAIAGCREPENEPVSFDDRMLSSLVEDYFAERDRFYPVEVASTAAHGERAGPGRWSEASFRLRIDWLINFRERLAGLDSTALSHEAHFDAMQISLAVRAELLELDEREVWRHAPAYYLERLRSEIGSLARSRSQPAHVRAKTLAAYLARVGEFLREARENLRELSELEIADALDVLDSIENLRRQLPKAFAELTDRRTLGELATASSVAGQALAGFASYLRQTEPTPDRVPSLGAELLGLFFRYEAMEERRPDEIGDAAWAALRTTQAQMTKTAANMDPARSPIELLRELRRVGRESREPVAETEALLRRLQGFVARRDLVGLPEDIHLPVMESSFTLKEGAGAELHIETGGGRNSASAVLLVAPMSLAAPYQIATSSSQTAGRDDLTLDVVSEAIPGRFLRILSLLRSSTVTRRRLAFPSNVGGWSLYAEHLVLAEGYDPENPALRMVALHRALRAQARLVAVIRFHVGAAALEELASFFETEVFLDPLAARREAARAAADPAVGLPALGASQISELRETFGRAHGRSLRLFHDRFLDQGAGPVPLVRRMLLETETALASRITVPRPR